MREELRIYGVFEPINAEVDSGWLPRNFGLSLAIKRASPSRIRQRAREEPRDCDQPVTAAHENASIEATRIRINAKGRANRSVHSPHDALPIA